jgi:hypothetical protein
VGLIRIYKELTVDIRKIGRATFFTYAALILIGAVLLMYFADYVQEFDPSGGGGFASVILLIMLGLGIAALVGAASIGVISALIGLVTSFLTSIYRTSNPQNKRKVM